MIAQASELVPAAIAAVRADGGMRWQEQAHPWHYLPRLLGDAAAQPVAAPRHWLLLLKAGARRLALEVDAINGNQEIVVKRIGPQLARIAGLAGATVLGDGEIALILDPFALAGRHVAHAAPQPPVVEAALATAMLPDVLVVDDSLTVRKVTGRLLERAGYRVRTAKDGIDALEQLAAHIPAVILADIEMPRMDGFELARQVRAHPDYEQIPIVMITSRSADKHRNHARELGVDHYLGKPYDEAELLRIVAAYAPRQR
jgi:chemosensory pili system protein ChpA (sensor histidine kinase/response regulator)